ncbi:MAG: hypothetical protein IJU23_04210 [Proteobacteria bacterium]|nr:hypothetical protein [Pseudomonadota bacterium]
MTLLLSVFAAVISTFVWYKNAPEDIYRTRTLCFMFWGASLMWLVDAVFEYVEASASYFTPAPLDMLNDAFLGLAVIALGLVVWIVDLLVHDPKKVVKAALLKSQTDLNTSAATTAEPSKTV